MLLVTVKQKNTPKDNTKTDDKIHFLNVNGDSIILESNGEYALIDAAGITKTTQNTKADDQKKIFDYINKLKIKEFKFIILTHYHGDHRGNLVDVIKKEGLKVGTLYLKKHFAPQEFSEYAQENMQKDIEDAAKKNPAKTKIVYVDEDSNFKGTAKYGNASTPLTLGDMKIDLYNTRGKFSGENSNSIVSLVNVNNHNVLLPGDETNSKVWNSLFEKEFANINKFDVISLPHHGSLWCLGKEYNGHKVSADYYVKTRSGISNVTLKPDHDKSCFMQIATTQVKDEKKQESKAEEIMCETYYSKNAKEKDGNSVIANLTNSKKVVMSGGGIEKNKDNAKCSSYYKTKYKK